MKQAVNVLAMSPVHQDPNDQRYPDIGRWNMHKKLKYEGKGNKNK